jgi:hypothetical protein
MVETNMNSPVQFRNVSVQISEKEFNVTAQELTILLREVAFTPVRLQVFGAEHSRKPLEPETVKGNIKGDREQQSRFS